MTSHRFFRISLSLPLLVPLLAWPWMHSSLAPVNTVLMVLVMSGSIAGLPYALFALLVYLKLPRACEATPGVPSLIWYAPLLFLPFAFLTWLGFFLQSTNIQEGWLAPLMALLIGFIPFAVLVLQFGYLYTVITIVVFKLVAYAGWITASDNHGQ